MNCIICSHPQRLEIDEELLARNWGESSVTLASIVEKYKVPLGALQQHAVLHFQAPVMDSEQQASITDKIKFREADLLKETASEYYLTMKNLGQKLNSIIAGDPMGLKLIQPALVELYLGAGKSVRDTIDALMRLDQNVNGETNTGLTALASLVEAIHGVKHD